MEVGCKAEVFGGFKILERMIGLTIYGCIMYVVQHVVVVE
jgi:hypothetical protein